MESNVIQLLIILISSLLLLFIVFYFIPFGSFVKAKLSGIEISLLDLVFMRYRKIPVTLVVNSLITSAKAGIIINIDELEALYLAGGNIEEVTEGIIYSKAIGKEISFKEACRIHFSRKDIITELNKP